MRAIDAMAQSMIEARANVRMHRSIVTAAQAKEYMRGELGHVRAFQSLEQGSVLALVCDNGTIFLGINPVHGLASLKALANVQINLGKDALDMTLKEASEDGQDAILNRAAGKLGKLGGR